MPSTINSQNTPVDFQAKSIISDWANATNWGIFGPQRRVEVLVNDNGDLASIRLVSQSFLGRLIDWIGKPFGGGQGLGRTTELLKTDDVFNEIWKSAVKNLQATTCSHILTIQIEDAIKKSPAEIAQQLFSVAKTFKLRSKAEEFKNQLANLDKSIQSEWDLFLQRRFSIKAKNLSDLEKEINNKQQSILNHFQDLEAIEARLGEGDPVRNIPPLEVRYTKLLHPRTLSTDKNIKETHRQWWRELQQLIEHPHSIEEIEQQHAVFQNAEATEKALFAILQSPAILKLDKDADIEDCLKAAQDKVVDLLKQLSPKLSLPDTISQRFIEERVKILNTPTTKNNLDPQNILKLKELNTYLQCMELLHKTADKGLKDLEKSAGQFKSHLEFFGTSIEEEWEAFIKEKSNLKDVFKESLKDEIQKKQSEIIEKCRTICLQETENALGSKSQLRERYNKIILASNPHYGYQALIALREHSWQEIQNKIHQASSIEEIENGYKHVLDEQIIDDELIETLQKNSSKSLTSCSNIAKAKAIEALQKLSPGLISPKAISTELLEERLLFFTSIAKHMNEEHTNALHDLATYIPCMKLLQAAAEESIKAAVSKWTQYLPATFNPHMRKSAEVFLQSFEKSQQSSMQDASDPNEAVATDKMMQVVLAQAIKDPTYYFDNTLYSSSLAIACIGSSADQLNPFVLAEEGEQLDIGSLSIEQIYQERDQSKERTAFTTRIKCLESFVAAALNSIDLRMSEVRKRAASLNPKQLAQLISSQLSQISLHGVERLKHFQLKKIIEGISELETMLKNIDDSLFSLEKIPADLIPTWPSSEKHSEILDLLEKIPNTNFVRQFCIDKIIEGHLRKLMGLAPFWQELGEQLSNIKPTSDEYRLQLQEFTKIAADRNNSINTILEQYQTGRDHLTSKMLESNYEQLEEIEKDWSYLEKCSFIEKLPGTIPIRTLLSQNAIEVNKQKIEHIKHLIEYFEDKITSAQLIAYEEAEPYIESFQSRIQEIQNNYMEVENQTTLIPMLVLAAHGKELATMENRLNFIFQDIEPPKRGFITGN